MKRSHELAILIAIIALGALLRGLYLSEIVKNPDFDSPAIDASYHDYWARGLVSGNWIPPAQFPDPEIRTTPFFRPPGYPYFLALVYGITGSSYLMARTLQMLIGLASCLLAYMLGKRLFGSRAGLIYAGCMSLYWAFIYFEGELLEPVLLVPLALSTVYVLALWNEKPTLGKALLAGVILGLYALVRPNALVFGLAAVGWAYWIARRRSDLRLFRNALIGLALGTVLMILPVTVRNYVVARDFVPISSNAGINLHLGNNPSANGYTAASPIIRRWTCYDYPTIVRDLEQKLGKPLKHSEVSAYYTRQAVDFLRDDPGSALGLAWKKTLLFWGPKEVGNEKEDECERANSRVLRNLPGGFPTALSVGVLGLAMLFPSRRRKLSAKQPVVDPRLEISVLVLLFVGTYFSSYLPFFVAGRYRVPMVPFLLLFGAYGIDRIWDLAARRELKTAAGWVAAWAGLYALASWNLAGYEPNVASWHFARGVRYDVKGRLDLAIGEYRRALNLKPNYPDALYNMGVDLGKQGRIDDAIARFSEILDLRPDDRRARYNLAIAYANKGSLDQAVEELKTGIELSPDDFQARLTLGEMLAKSGRLDEAAAHYRDIVRVAPDLAAVHTSLGKVLAVQGKLKESVAEFTEAARLEPRDPQSYYNLGVALAGCKDYRGAAEQYSRALDLKPDYVSARHNLAVAYYFTGDYAKAWEQVQLNRKYGAAPRPNFLAALSSKMPEPK